MPSANKTPNIGLNQWQGNEYPKRQDFVDDNAAVDLEIVKKASSTQDGRMAKEDKVKLDGISTGANKVEQSSTNGNIKINGTEKTVYTHPGSGTNPHGTTKSDVGLGNVTNDAQVKRTEMGTNNGVATLDASGVNAQAPKVHTHTKSQITDFPTSMPADGGNASTANKLATARTISLIGDATGSTPFDGSANKSITVVLANSGATAGTYTKLTIDAKGRVISATNLSASDIPNLDWSKIASGKPTTLAGYGVTDAVSKYIVLPSGTDLNTVVTSGFYRLDATSPNYTNLPPNSNVGYGQLIVSRGVDTAFQIITGYSNNEYYMRQGAKGGGTDTNFTTWQPWRKLWHDGNFDPDTKTKRVILTGQLQLTSYRKSVIALCEVTNDNPNLDSYSSGIISFHRYNGTLGAEINSLYVGAEKKYNTSNMSYFGLGLGNNIVNLRPCTFTYNGKKYGGVEFYFMAAPSSTIEFMGSSNFNIFGLDYYATDTSTVLNQEIYDSLEFDTTVNKLPNLVYNNEKVITREEQGGINLLSNGSFDNGLNSWTKNNTATLSIISDEKFSKCCKIVTSVQGGGIYNRSPSAIKNDAGTYVYSAWLKADAPLTIAFGLDNNRQTITLTTEWTRYYFIQNKNPGANNILSIFSWDTSGSTVTFYVANAQVETGTMITDWKPSVEDNKTYSDNKILSLGTTTNSGNAYTLTAPTGFTLQDGQLLVVKFNAASTGAITVNVGGTGAKAVKDYFGNDVTNVRANLPANLVYESSSDSFILQGKGGGGNAVAGDLLSGKTATVDAGQITGTIPSKSAQTYTPGTSNQTIASGQYLDGVQTILGDAALISANIKANASIFNVAGKSTVIETTESTNPIATNTVRSGKKGFVNGAAITGGLAVQATGPQTVTPGTSDIVKAAGIYDGPITIKGDADLVSANIKAEANIFGVAGKTSVVDTADATGVAGDVLSTKTVYINGVKTTGTMPNRGVVTLTPGTTDQTISNGYHNGSGIVKGDANLKPENIREDVGMFGKIGTLKPYELTAGDSNVLFLDSQQYNTTSYTRVKVGKTITTNIKGKIRISFDLRCGGSASLGYEVDKNGSLVTSNSYNSTSWTTETIDVTCSQGDVFEFLIKSYNEDYNAYIKNIKVSTDLVSPLTIA
ncbi:hypothetical protein [Clostridium kluyveri]|uniref:Uncharacterized protein n=1 Tax=Clostridium kluyveri TaxID=1534 RepID=A0A1L5FBZ9_CLOKL|nr:hypothetical protein [Clostridium kluyveri]APM40536.1 hypothetical protein BS101_18295 [Clostridium kluyveri]